MFIKSPRDYISYSTHKIYIFLKKFSKAHLLVCMSFRVNSGFEEQLCLYEAMQCEVDTSSPLYKQYRLTKITEKYPGNHTHTFWDYS